MQIGRSLERMVENDRIDGWRAIAAYLLRDERTAKRWEKHRGLPVRRVPGEGRANVYVLRSEVEAWLQGRTGLQTGSAANTSPAPEILDDVLTHIPDHIPDPIPASGAMGAFHGFSRESWSSDTPLPASDPSALSTEAAVTHAAAPGSALPNDAVQVDPAPGGLARFQLSEHISLLVSAFGLLVLLAATAVRFFHVGPLEAIMFASESGPSGLAAPAGNTSHDNGYLRAVFLCDQRSPASLEQARALFEEAIAQNPDDAPSYGGLAKTYLLLREYTTMPHAEAYSRARDAAEHALQLDPNQAEAHAAMGFIDFFWLWKAPEAEHEFALATRIDEHNALAHQWYGSMLMHQGRSAEALAHFDLAQRLNPTSTAVLASKALALGFSGEKDAAIQLLESIDSGGRDAAMVHRNLALLHLVAPRDTGRFLAEMERFASLRHDTGALPLLAEATRTYGAQGETAMWQAILDGERATHPDAAHPTYLMAQAEAMLGHEDASLRMLSCLTEDRDAQLMGLVLEPAFLPLHRNAEFTHLAERLGLVYPAVATR